MKWEATVQHPKATRLVIEEDQGVGFYLYVFEGDRCAWDYLQDSLDAAKDQAEYSYGVPKDSWRPSN